MLNMLVTQTILLLIESAASLSNTYVSKMMLNCSLKTKHLVQNLRSLNCEYWIGPVYANLIRHCSHKPLFIRTRSSVENFVGVRRKMMTS